MNDLPPEAREAVDQLAKQLMDEGRLLEAGFVALRFHYIPRGAPAHQVDDMRHAYMAGAQHLFASIMRGMDEGDDVTDSDLGRLDKINAELEHWRLSVGGPG
jgi:hypothetical protein